MVLGQYIAIPLTVMCELLLFQGSCGPAAHGVRVRVAVAYRSGNGAPVAASGSVLTWGANNVGQLGIGSPVYSPAPVSVHGVADVTAVAAARVDTTVLTRDGAVWAWGADIYGALGDGLPGGLYLRPVRVRGLPPVTAIATGDNSTLALSRDGTVWAWGTTSFGQLGTGNDADGARVPPARVQGLAHIVAIAVGAPSPDLLSWTGEPIGNDGYLALRRDGTVWAWGQTLPLDFNVRTPVPIAGLRDVVGIALGSHHALALRRDGTVWAWADDDRYGQMGTGVYTSTLPLYTPTPLLTPTRVPGLTDVAAIAAAGFHSLALKRDGAVWAWGLNVDGALGIGVPCLRGVDWRRGRSEVGARCIRAVPARVAHLTHVVAIAAGIGRSLALEHDGTAWAWGANNAGQLGAGTSGGFSATPVRVRSRGRLIAIAAGDSHSVAVRVAP